MLSKDGSSVEREASSHSVSILFEGEETGLIYNCLLPEIGDIGGRSETRMSYEDEDERLIIDVEADDFVALRAAVNTWLRLSRIALEMSKSV